MRFGVDASLALGGGSIYYGSVDATPLFVDAARAARWGIAQNLVDTLLPHADAALQWVLKYGDRDGDGFVEYERSSDRGLVHQGWKDSWDGVTHADGRSPKPPIALCEVQGYVYAAYIARSHFARETGDESLADEWSERARTLKDRFNESFWLPDRGYAMALDGDKRPVDALASNMGHCLWTGIVDEDKAASVARHLSARDVQRLGSAHARHVDGGVQPAELSQRFGLAARQRSHRRRVDPIRMHRSGAVDHPRRTRAASAFDGRLPELMCGFDRAEYPRPVPYPTSCSPQAWASASPVQLLRSLLRFDPWVPQGKAVDRPCAASRPGGTRVRGVRLGGSASASRQEAVNWSCWRCRRGWMSSPSRGSRSARPCDLRLPDG